MKARHVLTVVCLFAIICTVAGCTAKSSRETPVVKVVREYAPSVVNIRTESVVDLKEHPHWGRYGERLDKFFQQYFGDDYSKGTVKLKSLGSGVIVNNKGLIVTNAHVVMKATTIFVVLNEGTVLESKVVAVSRGDDIALIKTTLPHPVSELKFANTGNIMIGETVIAIGNPFGLENSVTVGVISGIKRNFTSRECEYTCSGLLQTDASVNPGNSGGALLNLDGELVGINLAVVAGAQNIGFAIPVDRIVRLLTRYK